MIIDTIIIRNKNKQYMSEKITQLLHENTAQSLVSICICH